MNLDPKNFPVEGGCDCRSIRYRLETTPLVVHLCHCKWCQRESGTAFALNAMIESDRITLLPDSTKSPLKTDVPSESGSGQTIHRCPDCRVAVWSNYGDPDDLIRLLRVGTLDRPEVCPPSIQIYVESKLPWVGLVEGVPVREKYYKSDEVWSKESLERRLGIRDKMRALELAREMEAKAAL